MEALLERFEPASKCELYVQVRRKKKTESWADFADDLMSLADKAYADLQEEGTRAPGAECLLGAN